jgi:hypothetical protein
MIKPRGLGKDVSSFKMCCANTRFFQIVGVTNQISPVCTQYGVEFKMADLKSSMIRKIEGIKYQPLKN